MKNGFKIKKVCYFLTLFLMFFWIRSYSQTSLSKSRQAEDILNNLSLEEKIGQLMMIPVHAAGNEKHYEKVRKLIEEHHVGGIIFMQGDPVAQANLTNSLQQISRVPLLIAMDAEWGLGMRLDSTISYPIAMALGAIDNDSLIFSAGREIGRQMRLLGVHMNFAPVVDINTNPQNPVIGMRAFSDDQGIVLNKASLFADGLMSSGILPVIKHFPGQGESTVDSHIDLPVINSSKETLQQRELVPFKELAEEGIPAIMTGHLFVPELANDGLPISLSSKVIDDILRDEWGYDGLVITDALVMGAVSENYKRGQAEELALKAGNDILLFPQDIQQATKRIKKAIRKGTIKISDLDNAVRRILEAKIAAGAFIQKPVSVANLHQKLNSPSARLLNNELISKSITLLKNKDDHIPLKELENKNFASLTIGKSKGTVFNEFLSKYTSIHTEEYSEKNLAGLKNLALYDVVVTSIFTSSVDSTFITFLNGLNARTKLIVVAFGSPYKLEYFEKFDHVIWVPEQTAESQQIAAQQIFGALPFSGKLPISLEQFKRGDGIVTSKLNRLSFDLPEAAGMDSYYLNQIDEIAREAITERSTPGMQVLVARKGKVVWNKSYGFQTYDSITPVTENTIYDLASITKVAASVQVLMFLFDRGLIDLDKKISTYLPDLVDTNKENMTLREILTHQAGLWPYLPFYQTTLLDENEPDSNFYRFHPELNFVNQVSSTLYTSTSIEDSVWTWVKDSKLRKKEPRIPYDYRYSDMGYYIVHRIAEKMLNQPLEEFLDQNLYEPLGARTLTYVPLCKYPVMQIAPTEMDTYFRYELVCGHVHDQGAALLGGVAGHAGLFSNSLDLAKLMQLMLEKGSYGGSSFYQPETIELFTAQQYESNRRGLGWDKPVLDRPGGPTSDYASSKTFGHTGFTGTAAWVDPEFDLIYIFLSNRVYPEATNTKLISTNVRTRIQDVIYKAIFKQEQYEEIQ